VSSRFEEPANSYSELILSKKVGKKVEKWIFFQKKWKKSEKWKKVEKVEKVDI
jgi:hypothetical protein